MKIEIGKLIEIVDERNTDASINTFYGININKEFMPTVANTDGIDCKKYKVVRKNRFVFSGMQTGRDECIRIGLFTEDDPIIISPAYTTFEITRSDLVLNKYFFMRFLSKEMDRYGSFLSDSSIRSNLDWERFCEIEIDLPSIIVQKKYVDVYNSLLQNQKVYEKGLDDLKLTCDAYIENLRHDVTAVTIGDYIKESDERNTSLKYDVSAVKGVSIQKTFIETKADMDGVSLSPYLIVHPDYFSFVSVTSRNGGKISIAYNDRDESFIVSSSYIVFNVERIDILLPEFLFIFLNRSEFDRFARFYSWGSAREVFSFEDMKEVKIPIPDMTVQQAIVDIFYAYSERKAIVEKLKGQIKDICPILVRGAMEEGG